MSDLVNNSKRKHGEMLLLNYETATDPPCYEREYPVCGYSQPYTPAMKRAYYNHETRSYRGMTNAEASRKIFEKIKFPQ
ncbi:unnamed protein product, partial [Nesidiocoris tenuis]